MKRALFFVTLALGFLSMAYSAETGLEFSGVLGGGKDLRVALTNKANGVTQWVAIGSSIAGHYVSAYDEKADVVVLTKEGQTIRLALKQGKKASATKPSPEVERAVLNNLRQLAAAADQFYLENRKTTTSYDELVGPTKYVKSITPVNGENYRALQFVQGVRYTVTTADGQSVSYEP